MDIYRLSMESQFIDPRWLSRGHTGRYPIENNGVIIAGERLTIRGKQIQAGWKLEFEPTQLVDGTVVEVWTDSGGFFVCALAADVDREKAERSAKAAAEEAERSRRLAERQAAAIAFNAALPVPVKWTPGIKDVLSGLTENSNGTGTNARTVVHICLEEVLTDGRFTREAGDFLCTSASGSNGKQWSSQKRENSQVTCKTCLKLVQRWVKG